MKLFTALMLIVLSSGAWAQTVVCSFEGRTTLSAKILENGKKLELLSITTVAGRGEYGEEDIETYGAKVATQKTSRNGLARFFFEDVGNDTNWLHNYNLYVAKNLFVTGASAAKLSYYYSDEYGETDSWYVQGTCNVQN